MDLLDRSLGDIATSIAGATALFHKHRLDFCCGGGLSLRDAVAKRGIGEDALLTALEALRGQAVDATDWRQAPVGDLIDHILQRFHERHGPQLEELIRLSRRVEQVHGGRADCPHGLADHLERMRDDLESHMAKEEQILFPMLRNALYPAGPISVLELEDDVHGESLETLDDLTGNITLPVDACNTWRALYLGLAEFREDLMEHILLENSILFVPRTAA